MQYTSQNAIRLIIFLPTNLMPHQKPLPVVGNMHRLIEILQGYPIIFGLLPGGLSNASSTYSLMSSMRTAELPSWSNTRRQVEVANSTF